MNNSVLGACVLGAASLVALAACGRDGQPPQMDAVDTGPRTASVAERWLTPRNESDNVDSVAVWHSRTGDHWLLATAKATDVLLVYDAVNGAPLRRVGGSGSGLGEFRRPNGVTVMQDLAFIVERDNARVQVLRLPELAPVGVFGEDLVRPYGIFVHATGEGTYEVFVTDNYEQADERIPPDEELGERVRKYRVTVNQGGLQAELARAFGATDGPGVLRKVESIFGDAEHDRLLLAEELESERTIKIYDFAGEFTGQIMGEGVFRYEPEGIALYRCAGGAGYWFVVDQDQARNVFNVFDRRSLEPLGRFAGEVTRNTDGIWLTQQPMEGFAGGALYAVHDDGNVAAFDLDAALAAMNLETCAASASS